MTNDNKNDIIISRRYHDGVVSRAHLDNDKQVSKPETTLVKQIEFADGRTIEYEYDKEERITKVIDTVDGVETSTEYTYDALGQLLTETVNDVKVNEMTYDEYGNIKTKNGIEYGYDSAWKDKLTSYNGQTIVYDANGNPTSYLGTSATWEEGRQLKTFGANKYWYNKDGIRIKKRTENTIHEYTLDGTNIIKETVTDICNCPKYVNEYLYDLDGTVCGLNHDGTAYYFYKNLQGDVIAITDNTGTVVARYTYDAWGKCTITSDTSGVNIATVNPFRYRSYYYDTETKLYYIQSRYYDPEVGRFINADTIESFQYLHDILDLNLYAYVKNCTVVLTDDCGEGWIKNIFKKAKSKTKNVVNTTVNIVQNAVTPRLKNTPKAGIIYFYDEKLHEVVWLLIWEFFCKRIVWEKFCKEMVYNTFIKKWVWQTFCKKWIWETFCKKWVWQTFCKKWIWEIFCKKWIVSAWNWLDNTKAGQIIWNATLLVLAIISLVVSIIGCGSPYAPVAVAGVVLSAIGVLGSLISLLMAIF